MFNQKPLQQIQTDLVYVPFSQCVRDTDAVYRRVLDVGAPVILALANSGGVPVGLLRPVFPWCPVLRLRQDRFRVPCLKTVVTLGESRMPFASERDSLH